MTATSCSMWLSSRETFLRSNGLGWYEILAGICERSTNRARVPAGAKGFMCGPLQTGQRRCMRARTAAYMRGKEMDVVFNIPVDIGATGFLSAD